jgi:peptidyl-prolyl cis-trans isomerase C
MNIRSYLGATLALVLLGGLVFSAVAQQGAKDRRSQVRGGRDYLPSQETERVDTLAWVGGKAITRQDLESRLDELAPNARSQFETPDGRRQLINRMVEEQVWLYEAEQADIASRPNVKQQLEGARRNLLIRTLLQDVMAEVPAPSDSMIEAYYEEHQDEPQYRTRDAAEVRHIQLETEDEARRVLNRLQRNGDFDEMVERYSTDGTTKENGGKLGRIERGNVFGSLGRQMALAESVFTAPVGVAVGPFKSSVGWHVLIVDELIPAEPLPVQSVSSQISALLSRQIQEDYYKEQLARAETDAALRWNDAAIDSLLYGSKPAPELFRDAQAAPTADSRLAGYNMVVERYPQSEFAPQAQFMIGFIYSEEKKDYDSAEAAFKKLIADYPKSELAGSAEWMLENMRTEEVPSFDPAVMDTLPQPEVSGSPEN